MRTKAPAFLPFVVALSVAWAQPAEADPFEFEIAGRIGAGTTTGWIANPYALGFGGRAGVSAYGVYAGISGIYYLGGSFGGAGFHTALVGVEAGYTFRLGGVRIRPQLGLGDGTFFQTASDGLLNPPITTSVGNLYLEPGVVVLVPVGPLFLGADASALVLPHFTLATATNAPAAMARTYGSFTAHAQVGVFF